MVVLDDGPDRTTRYRLLETLRQYALERLDDTGHTEERRRRHAEHYATFAETAGPGLEGPDEAIWFPRFDVELANLRVAVAWALEAEARDDAELGLRIIAPLTRQLFCRPSAGVGEWAEAALGRAETSTPGRRAAVLAAAAWKATFESDFDLARARAAEALRDGLPPDTPSPGFVHAVLASSEAVAGRDQGALGAIAAGHQALDAIGANDYAYLVLDISGVVVRVLAAPYDEARARAAAEELLHGARTLSNPSVLIQALRWFAGTRRPDENDDTIQALEQCLAHSRAVATPDNPDVVQALALLARLRAGRGERTPAIEALREAVVRGHDTGQVGVVLSWVLSYSVGVAADLDAPEFAATLGAALTDGPLAGMIYRNPALTDRQAGFDHARAQLDLDRYGAAHATRHCHVVRPDHRVHPRRARPTPRQSRRWLSCRRGRSRSCSPTSRARPASGRNIPTRCATRWPVTTSCCAK